jgi:hypothetical protein
LKAHPVRIMESRLTFFRQSGWLVVATVASGVFMTATQIVASRWMDPGEWGLWLALLRIYLLMSIPSAGLQIIFAQQTAAAVTLPKHHISSADTVRSTLKATFIFWLLLAVVAFAGTHYWMDLLKISRPAAWHCTLLIGLASLWSPLVRGILQGQQNFLGLGWVLDPRWRRTFCRGLDHRRLWRPGGRRHGRSPVWHRVGHRRGGMVDPRSAARTGQPMDWRPWLRRTVPFTLAIGSVQFMMIVDVPYVRSVFPGPDRDGIHARRPHRPGHDHVAPADVRRDVPQDRAQRRPHPKYARAGACLDRHRAAGCRRRLGLRAFPQAAAPDHLLWETGILGRRAPGSLVRLVPCCR